MTLWLAERDLLQGILLSPLFFSCHIHRNPTKIAASEYEKGSHQVQLNSWYPLGFPKHTPKMTEIVRQIYGKYKLKEYMNGLSAACKAD